MPIDISGFVTAWWLAFGLVLLVVVGVVAAKVGPPVLEAIEALIGAFGR